MRLWPILAESVDGAWWRVFAGITLRSLQHNNLYLPLEIILAETKKTLALPNILNENFLVT